MTCIKQSQSLRSIEQKNLYIWSQNLPALLWCPSAASAADFPCRLLQGLPAHSSYIALSDSCIAINLTAKSIFTGTTV